MYERYNIQKFTAAFLLAVFALAISPKKTLHQFFANHTDAAAKSSDNKTEQLNKAGFNCQCDDQVAESNFLGAFFPVTFPLFQDHLFLNQPTISFVSVSSLFKELRGPPSNFLRS